MKKVLALVTVAVLSLGLFVGCGKTESGSDKTITLAVWGSSPAEIEALDATIRSFTEKTGITVEKEAIQDKYMDVMKARFSANNAPDVFYVDSFELPALAESGVLLDQTDSIVDKEDFYEPLLNAFKGSNGEVFGVPKDYSTLAVYVNTKLLSEAGITSADIPTNMNDFFKFSEELKSKLPEGVAPLLMEKDLARHLDELDALGVTVIKEDGTANFSEDPKVEEYFQKYINGKKNGSIVLAKEDLGSDSGIAAFGSEKVAMMVEGNWSLGAFSKDFPDLKFETVKLPTIDGKDHTMSFTTGYAISKNAKNVDGAKEFVNYMTNDGQEEWSTGSGVLPSRKSISEKMNVASDPLKKAHVEGAEYATVWSRGITMPVINTAFGNNFTAALMGQSSLSDSLKGIDKEANDEIKRQQ